jgi:hypothetical protein
MGGRRNSLLLIPSYSLLLIPCFSDHSELQRRRIRAHPPIHSNQSYCTLRAANCQREIHAAHPRGERLVSLPSGDQFVESDSGLEANGSAATMLVALLSLIFLRRNRGHQQPYVSETKRPRVSIVQKRSAALLAGRASRAACFDRCLPFCNPFKKKHRSRDYVLG